MKNSNASPGDCVEIHLSKIIYEGILLESPQSEKGVVLLKLDSGYNIGFNRKDILKIQVLKKFQENKEKFEYKKDPSKPNIALIITGGTIASRLDPKTGGVNPLQNPQDLMKFYSSSFEKVNVLKLETPFMKASEEMDPKDWQKLAKIAVDLLNDSNIQGLIITHGTDTLHYTSSALSFFIKDINKPVVLTYSQRSSDRASSDANLNLKCSSLVAISDLAQVTLVGHSSFSDETCDVLLGTKVRKMHSSRRDTFKSINTKPLAKVNENNIEILSNYNKRNKNKAKLDNKFEEKIALVKIYPGQNPDILDYYLKNGYRGIILELSGLGNAPTKNSRNSWIPKLKEVQKKGLIVCATSQCIYGKTNPLVYSSGREVLETGVIFLEDMLAETAFVKLGWILGHEEWTKNKKMIKEKMLTNFAGEFNNRLEE